MSDVDEAPEAVRGEARWPMAAAVLVALLMTLIRPRALEIVPRGFLPVVLLVLLGVLIARDPGRIDRRSRGLRVVSMVVVALLALDAIVATGHLIAVLIEGGKTTSSAGTLLAAGGIVWVSNVIVFSLLYWELDTGGAAARAHKPARHPDFAFPQQLNPDLAPPGWRPHFIDYLYVGFTTANAFSPTDTMPMAHWAKVAMGSEALISFAIVGLVLARAVNVFT